MSDPVHPFSVGGPPRTICQMCGAEIPSVTAHAILLEIFNGLGRCACGAVLRASPERQHPVNAPVEQPTAEDLLPIAQLLSGHYDADVARLAQGYVALHQRLQASRAVSRDLASTADSVVDALAQRVEQLEVQVRRLSSNTALSEAPCSSGPPPGHPSTWSVEGWRACIAQSSSWADLEARTGLSRKTILRYARDLPIPWVRSRPRSG